jgi:hypothetical protein
MSRTQETPKAAPAIREMSTEAMHQAGGGAIMHGVRGIVVHDVRKQGGEQQTC